MDNWSLIAPGIAVREMPQAAIAMLRLRKPTPATIAAVGAALGADLPTDPNRATGNTVRAIWMGPDEWMVIGTTASAADIDAVSDAPATLMVPVSDGRYPVDVSGPAARDLLAKAISIDLYPGVFPVDATAMTLFAQVPVVIDHLTQDAFRLWFDVSQRHYVRTWLTDAVIEFG